MDKDSKKVLWMAVSALMKQHYGRENLTRLAKDCGFGPATSTRLREQNTSVGLDVIDKIAKKFGVEPWMLLVPDFEATNPPALLPVTEAEKRFHERVQVLIEELKHPEENR